MALFGKGMIKNNAKIARFNRDAFADAVDATKQQSRTTYWGLFHVLFKFDENAQDFIDNCDDYPEILPIDEYLEMEKIFSILSKRIDYILDPRTEAQRWEDDFFCDMAQQQGDLLTTI